MIELTYTDLFYIVSGLLALLGTTGWWIYRRYHRHTKNVLFLLEAIENNDYAIHFPDSDDKGKGLLVNQALNRVARTLYHAKSETIQREKYYELILNFVDTGIVVLNDNGAVHQKNTKALNLLGMEVFTHVKQLERVDKHLQEVVAGCRPGDKLQTAFCNERGTVNLSIRVSDISIRNEHLRILALNDINTELDEKEIDSWIRLTRVLTHEIMNTVTPITSLSDTLLTLAEAQEGEAEELCKGLQTISSTSKGLLAFVENYRRFTRIPTPNPSLFFVKEFVERMVEVARHQYSVARIGFQIDIQPADLILHADENLIAQVLINLLKNAIQAIETEKSGAEGIIGIRAYCDESEAVLIEVSDNGPAIPPDIAEHIFIPFFTTKEGGSGIGLSISRQIMRLSGGSLTLRQGKETTFVLRFD